MNVTPPNKTGDATDATMRPALKAQNWDLYAASGTLVAHRVSMRCVMATALLLVASASATAQEVERSTRDGVYTLAQARRGAAYVERCTPCHGSDLEGALGPALIGPVHIERWSGRPLADLFERILVNFQSLAKTGHADEAAPLAQRAPDFTAFLLLQNGSPAGLTELPERADSLRFIRIDPGRLLPHATAAPPR